MAAAPGMSLPRQSENWTELNGAYRLLHNESASPAALLAPHRTLAMQSCTGHARVLVVQDSTELDFSTHADTEGLGPIGNGHGLGLLQHSALAVSVTGELLGVLDLRWIVRDRELRTGETRTQLNARWRESMLWAEAAERVGPAPSGCRFIDVADRAADDFGTFEECHRQGHGFVIRAVRRRNVEGGQDKLWPWARALPRQGTTRVHVSRQSGHGLTPARVRRVAELTIRYEQVTLDPPERCAGIPRKVWVVYALEESPPTGKGVEPIEWMLLCSEPVENRADAQRMIEWYRHRWVIEEWHRALKEGCRLESSQLRDAGAIQRLATLLSVVAARLVQMRDLADPAHPDADNPEALRRQVSPLWIDVVATHRGLNPETLTPRMFHLAIAKRGGFLGRKHDGRPGWKTLWQGWLDYHSMIEFALALKDRGRSG